MRCQKREAGEPDSSGRGRPVAVEGSDFLIDVDTVIYALGTPANPIIAQTTPGLGTNKLGYIKNDQRRELLSHPGYYAVRDGYADRATRIAPICAQKARARGRS